MPWINTFYCSRHGVICLGCLDYDWNDAEDKLEYFDHKESGFFVQVFVPSRVFNDYTDWDTKRGRHRLKDWYDSNLRGIKIRR